MRGYELTLVFGTELDDSTRDETLKKIVGWLPLIEGSADPVIHQWGRRHLAYPINKQNEGYYVFIEANLNPVGVSELERNILYLQDVMRHLVIRKDE